jgi:pyruvate dehydrogenase E1 component alpha subunit
MTEAVKRAREGKGPSLIECKTYRHRGHFEGDPMVYRPKEEFELWLKKDPIPRFEATLREMKLLTDAQRAELRKSLVAEVETAIKFAEDSPWPEPAELLQDVYTGAPVVA